MRYSVDSDQIAHKEQSDQGLDCFLIQSVENYLDKHGSQVNVINTYLMLSLHFANVYSETANGTFLQTMRLSMGQYQLKSHIMRLHQFDMNNKGPAKQGTW